MALPNYGHSSTPLPHSLRLPGCRAVQVRPAPFLPCERPGLCPVLLLLLLAATSRGIQVSALTLQVYQKSLSSCLHKEKAPPAPHLASASVYLLTVPVTRLRSWPDLPPSILRVSVRCPGVRCPGLPPASRRPDQLSSRASMPPAAPWPHSAYLIVSERCTSPEEATDLTALS